MRFLLIILCFLHSLSGSCQGYLKANGKMIEDGNGKEILLRGIGLGGWMLQEPYMLQLSDVLPAQYSIKKKITELIGVEKTEKFYDAWLANHCTKADIDSLAAWGFNSIRLPMHYNLFTLPVEQEKIPGKNTWLSKGFAMTDSLLSWCKANHIYLILDLHATPGGQGNDVAISDRDSTKLSLWDSEPNRKKTIALWQQLVKRYGNEKWIGGYDLINEPNWGFESRTDAHGCAEKNNSPLKKFLQEITAAIRKIDKQHIIFIEGNCWCNNYSGMFPLWDNNMVVSFHKYWNTTDDASIQNFLDYRQKYNVPLWMGETGENSNTWITSAVQLFERNKIGWCMWPLKKAGLNNPLQIKINPGFQSVLNYWKDKGPKPSADDAYQGLMQFAAASNIHNNNVEHGVADAMMRQAKSAEAMPFKNNIIQPNAILFAADYDMGRSGIAYHDKDSADYWVSTSVKTPWNTGGKYRNDGVDIDNCSDNISNGYYVGWIEPGEWLQYTVFAKDDAVYDVNVRSAAKEKSGQLQLIVNDKNAGDKIRLPVTGKFDNWQTSTIKNIRLNKGWNRLRIYAASGGFNLNYLQFISADATVSTN